MSTGRRFQVWEYTVSHGQLLLRSVKSDDVPTRIDMLFKNVKAMSVAAVMSNLVISEDNDSDEGLHFLLAFDEGSGFVSAGTFITGEDEGQHGDPSMLPCWPMKSAKPLA